MALSLQLHLLLKHLLLLQQTILEHGLKKIHAVHLALLSEWYSRTSACYGCIHPIWQTRGRVHITRDWSLRHSIDCPWHSGNWDMMPQWSNTLLKQRNVGHCCDRVSSRDHRASLTQRWPDLTQHHRGLSNSYAWCCRHGGRHSHCFACH